MAATLNRQVPSTSAKMSTLNNQDQQAQTNASDTAKCVEHRSLLDIKSANVDLVEFYAEKYDGDDPREDFDLDVELAIRTIKPKYKVSKPKRDVVYEARMSLLMLEEDSAQYKELVQAQRDLFRGTKSWKSWIAAIEVGKEDEEKEATGGRFFDGEPMEID